MPCAFDMHQAHLCCKIVNMVTGTDKALREVCGGSEIRLRLLRALVAQSSTGLHLRGLARAAGVDAANALRLLRRLEGAGLCESAGGKYRVPPGHPLLGPLTNLFSMARGGAAQAKLDEIKRLTGERLVERHSMAEIRAKALQNLARWRAQGTWSAAYEEWQQLLEGTSDTMLRYILTSRDPDANRLRQSMPCVGLLARNEIHVLNEKIAA
jgi:hypothetical protein